jgi:hypothetical protein
MVAITVIPAKYGIIFSAAITGLSAAFLYYPNQLWIAAVLAGLGVFSTHVVQSASMTDSNLHFPGIPHENPPEPTNPFKGE